MESRTVRENLPVLLTQTYPHTKNFVNSNHDDDFRQDLLTKTKWLYLITVSLLLEHSLLVSVRRRSSERECLGQEMAVDDLVVFSVSLWAVKQAAWQLCLPRQVNKKKQPWGQQPASIITSKAARKTDTYWKSTHKKKCLITCPYLLPLQKKLIWRQRLFENMFVPFSSIFNIMFVLLYCDPH